MKPLKYLRIVIELIAFLVILGLVSFLGVLVNLHTGVAVDKGFLTVVIIASLFIWVVSRSDF